MALLIRPLTEGEVEKAQAIYRAAFRTFLGVPDEQLPDADYIRPRFYACPEESLAAELDGELIGVQLYNRWGSMVVMGPGVVKPTGWTAGAGTVMVTRAMDFVQKTGSPHIAGFTFSDSVGHINLQQRVGMYPRLPIANLAKPVSKAKAKNEVKLYSALSDDERAKVQTQARALTQSFLEGLDVTREMNTVRALNLGDTVLLEQDGALVGLALCHCGPGTEGGSKICQIKFGAVTSGEGAEARFAKLIDAAETLAARKELPRLQLGINLAHPEAFRKALAHGCMVLFYGVAMHLRNNPYFAGAGQFLIYDWR